MDIAFSRGDSFEIGFLIQDEETGEPITDQFDEVYFTAKHNYRDKEPALQLSMSNGDITSDGDGHYTLRIFPADTERMRFGVYDIDIEFSKEDYCKTFPGTMTLLKETTHYYNKG